VARWETFEPILYIFSRKIIVFTSYWRRRTRRPSRTIETALGERNRTCRAMSLAGGTEAWLCAALKFSGLAFLTSPSLLSSPGFNIPIAMTPQGMAGVLTIPGFTHPVRDLFLEDALEATGFAVGRGSKWAAPRRPAASSSAPRVGG